MVASTIATNTQVRITTPTGSFCEYPLSHVFDRVKVRWGRDSLYSPPSLRTATVTVLAPPFELRRLPKSTLTITVDFPGAPFFSGTKRVVFSGLIDTATAYPSPRGTVVELSATQATLTSGTFQGHTLPYNTLHETIHALKTFFDNHRTVDELKADWPQKVYFEAVRYPNVAYIPPQNSGGFIAQPLLAHIELISRTFPGAYLAFTADETELYFTTFSLVSGVEGRFQLSANKEILLDDKTVSHTVKTAPAFIVSTPTDGPMSYPRRYGTPDWVPPKYQAIVPLPDTPVNDLRMLRGYAMWTEIPGSVAIKDMDKYLQEFADLVAAQTTAPRKFTLSDLHTPMHWQLWETVERPEIIEIHGIDSILDPDKPGIYAYRPIGGELTITAAESTHTITCIHMAAKPQRWTNYPPRAWQDQPTPWIVKG